MTTPAQNVSQSVYVPRFSTWNGYNYSDVLPIEVRKLVRPQSVNNPVRSDGTRKPSNWHCNSFAQRPWLGSGTFQHRWDPNVKGHTSGLALMGAPTTIDSFLEVERLLGNNRLKALAQAVDSTKQLNAFLAQANSTGKMVGKAAGNFANGLDKLMQGGGPGKPGLFSRRGGFSKWRRLPGEYLEYCYGWKPLGDDVQNAFDRLSDMSDRGYGMRMNLRSRKSGPRQSLVYRNSNLVAMYPAEAMVNDVELLGFRESFCPVSYIYNLPDWLVENVPTVSFFSTLHELTPYSFVLDQFLPIGDWFGAIESAQFSPHFSEGSETIFIRDTYQSARLYRKSHDYQPTSWSASGSVVITKMVRSSLITPPLFTRPRWKPLPGLTFASQGLSLLAQTFQRWR